MQIVARAVQILANSSEVDKESVKLDAHAYAVAIATEEALKALSTEIFRLRETGGYA